MLPASDPSTLRAFLEHPARPAGTLSYHELQGFLFTVVSAPELVRPSEWLPIIFGEEEAGFASPDEAQGILGQIMALYNTINAAVLDPPTLLPADCPLRDDVLANFEDEAPIAQWSRGFLRGHQWLEDLWKESVPQEMPGRRHVSVPPPSDPHSVHRVRVVSAASVQAAGPGAMRSPSSAGHTWMRNNRSGQVSGVGDLGSLRWTRLEE